MSAERLLSSTFTLGAIHSLAVRSVGGVFYFNVEDPKLHGALNESLDYLTLFASDRVDLRFRIVLDETTQTSGRLEADLSNLIFLDQTRGINGSYVNLEYNSRHYIGRHVLDYITGGKELWQELGPVLAKSFEKRSY